MKMLSKSRRAYGSGVVAALVAASGFSVAVRGAVLFDSLTPIVQAVSGQVSTFNSGIPDTFIGGAYNVPTGTTSITGIDPCFLNGSNFNGSAFVTGAGQTYTGMLVNVYIWGTVNPLTGSSTSPAFSNLLGEESEVFIGSYSPGFFYFFGSGGAGAVGPTPVFTFNTPVALNGTTGSIGVTYNYEPTTDPINDSNYQSANYASSQYTTSIISYNAQPTTGSNPNLDYFRNAAGETNGNFNLSSQRVISGGTYTNVATRIFGGAPVVYNFINSSGGSFTDANNYNPNGSPTSLDTVLFNLSSPSAYNVSIPSLVAATTVSIFKDNVIFDLPAFASQIYFSNALTVGQSNTASGTTVGTLQLTNSANNQTNIVEAGNFVIGGNGGTGTLTIGQAIYAYSDNDTSIAANSKVIVQQFGFFRTGTLTFAGSSNAPQGQLDIGSSDVILRNGSIGAVISQIKSGYANGVWTGQGIVSSVAAADSTHLTAVGAIVNTSATGGQIYGNASTGTLGLFGGDNPNIGAVLVKYTFYGDANLDGTVDGSDYSLIDNGFTNHLSGWYNGDFNYDGVVDGSDYTLIDNAFNNEDGDSGVSPLAILRAGGAPRNETLWSNNSVSNVTPEAVQLGGSGPTASTTSQIAGTSVPEPASLGLLAVGAVSMLGRRSKRQKN